MMPVSFEHFSNEGGVLLGQGDLKETPQLYSCSRRSSKWWHKAMYYILDVMVINSFIISTPIVGMHGMS